jgi:hypothetical protein
MITVVILPQFNLLGTLRLEVMLRRTAVALVLLLFVTFSLITHCFSQPDDPQKQAKNRQQGYTPISCIGSHHEFAGYGESGSSRFE